MAELGAAAGAVVLSLWVLGVVALGKAEVGVSELGVAVPSAAEVGAAEIGAAEVDSAVFRAVASSFAGPSVGVTTRVGSGLFFRRALRRGYDARLRSSGSLPPSAGVTTRNGLSPV